MESRSASGERPGGESGGEHHSRVITKVFQFIVTARVEQMPELDEYGLSLPAGLGRFSARYFRHIKAPYDSRLSLVPVHDALVDSEVRVAQ